MISVADCHLLRLVAAALEATGAIAHELIASGGFQPAAVAFATAAAGADLGSGLRNASHLGRRSFARMKFHIRFHPS